jgi:uncharacterized protein YegP (UPF0339 family)
VLPVEQRKPGAISRAGGAPESLNRYVDRYTGLLKKQVGVGVCEGNATVEPVEDAEEKYRWRLVHDNGNLIAESGQGYASRQKAKQGLTSVRTNAPGAPVES